MALQPWLQACALVLHLRVIVASAAAAVVVVVVVVVVEVVGNVGVW